VSIFQFFDKVASPGYDAHMVGRKILDGSQFLISFLTPTSEISSFHRVAVNSTDEKYKVVLRPQDVISFVNKEGLVLLRKCYLKRYK